MSARAQPPTSVLIQDAILFLRWDAGPARGPARDRRSGADRSGADQGFIDDSLAGDGVLAPERLPKPVVAVELGGDGEQALDGRDVRFALGHRIEAAGIGEGVEIEGAVVAVAPDLAEQLERSTHMHRSHHEPVITLGVTVVQVHAEKPAAAMDEVGRKGWLLARVKSVGEVYRHAEVRRAGLRYGEKRRCSITKQAVGTRLIRLVLDADPAVRIMFGDGPDPGNFPVPDLLVVQLEAVIKAVLAEPDRHEVGAHGTRRVDAALGQVDGLFPHGFVWICEGAKLEGRIGIVTHGKAVDRQAEIADAA